MPRFLCGVVLATATLMSTLAMAQVGGGQGIPEIRLVPGPSGSSVPGTEVSPIVVPEIKLPVPTASAPAGAASPVPATPLAAPVTRDSAPVQPAAAANWVLPLVPANPDVPTAIQVGASFSQPGVLRLTGEVASTDLMLVLPEAAVPPPTLVLSMRSSVNIQTDRAALTLVVNGGEPVDVPLRNIGPFGTLQVPVAGLRPGTNQIAVSVRQPHRIFCGPDATFQVWTEINLADSGAILASGALSADAQGFAAALRVQVASGKPVQILSTADVDPALLRRASLAVADALGGTSPQIEATSFYQMDRGRYARVALIPSDKAGVSFRRDALGALVMQVEYAAGEAPDLSGVLPAAPIPTLATGPTLVPGGPVPLSSLGAPDFVGNTHYFHRDVNFRLPDDWLLLANQRAHFFLHYGFANDLSKGSLLLVKVNGVTVRLLPLDRNGGKVLPPLDIGFAANLLRPGPDTLTLEMMVPGDPASSPCGPRKTDMLAVLGDSSLVIPQSPGMRLPGFDRALAALGPDSVTVPTEAADFAQLSRAILPLAVTLKPVDPGMPPAVLNVVDIDNVDIVPLQRVGLNAKMLQDAVFPHIVTEAPALHPASAPGQSAFRLSDSAQSAAGPALAAPGFVASWWASVLSQFTTHGWLARQWQALSDAAYLNSDGPLPKWLEGKAGQALLLRPDQGAPETLWLVVGPEVRMPDLARSFDRFRRSGLAHGEAALLQRDGSWLVWSSGAAPVLLESLHAGNIRAVLGNYASWSPLLFTVVLLVLALVSVLPALLYILLTRRRGGGT